MYGKQTETAIAAVSFLAEIWQGPRTRRVSAADIADARDLQRPFVAKLLSALSQAGIVSGSPGPGGGYALAKNPDEIRLRDVWVVFERPEPRKACLFMKGQTEENAGNELHQRIEKVYHAVDSLLDDTTFEVFAGDEDTPVNKQPTVRLSAIPASNGHNGANGHNGTNRYNGTNGHNGTNESRVHSATNGH